MGKVNKGARFQEDSSRGQEVLRDFGGVNTQPYRTAIKDNEFSWIENIQPIGFANAKVVPTSTLKATTGDSFAAESIYYAMDANINGVDFSFLFCVSGAAYQVNMSTFVSVKFAAAATFGGTATRASQWKNERIVIVDPSKGYYDWNGTALTLIDVAKKGSFVASFAGRVWIAGTGVVAGARTINFTDVNSYNSFAGAGGSFFITDSTLHGGITALSTANNFLYIWGDDSINALGDVRVSGGVTLFSNTNIQAAIGANIDTAIFPFFRAIMFMNKYGIYALYGATPQKISDPLDGVFPNIQFTGAVSGGAFVLNNIICAGFLFTYSDNGVNRQLLAVYFNNKWFFSSQGTITFMWTAFINGVLTLYGTGGNNIYQLFADSASAISWKLQSKLFDFGDNITDHQSLKFGIEAVLPSASTTLNVTIDTEVSSINVALSRTNILDWVNNSSTVLQWVNNTAVPLDWLGSGFSKLYADVETVGKYLGSTITSTSPGVIISAEMFEFEPRARW